MALSKKAKMLTPEQIDYIAEWLDTRQDPLRDTCIFYLSVYAGFRAKEIANLTWEMIGADCCIHLVNAASKGSTGGRVVPIHPKLMAALRALQEVSTGSGPVVRTRDGEPVTAHYVVKRFGYIYSLLDMKGCSSHSGRRTFITNAARRISTVGGSLYDVQVLAGHSHLSTTQAYIVGNETAQRAVVNGM